MVVIITLLNDNSFKKLSDHLDKVSPGNLVCHITVTGRETFGIVIDTSMKDKKPWHMIALLMDGQKHFIMINEILRNPEKWLIHI